MVGGEFRDAAGLQSAGADGLHLAKAGGEFIEKFFVHIRQVLCFSDSAALADSVIRGASAHSAARSRSSRSCMVVRSSSSFLG